MMNIQNIPTEQFTRMLKVLAQNDWKTIYAYDGVDAWIDYGEVHLSKDGRIVKFVWDNWMEGGISAEEEIDELRALL